MKRTLTFLTLAVLLTATINFGQSKDQLSTNQIQTLISGINSENTGLKRSSIFFAGFYKIEETVDELREEMLFNNDPDIKILAALALYEIGNENVLNDLDQLSKSPTENDNVRRMASAIYQHWVNENRNFVSVSR